MTTSTISNDASTPQIDAETGISPVGTQARTPNGDSDLLDETANMNDTESTSQQPHPHRGALESAAAPSPSMAKIAAIVDQVRNKRQNHQAVDVAAIARGEVDKFYDYNEEEEQSFPSPGAGLAELGHAEDLNSSSTSVTLANKATSIISSYSEYIREAVAGNSDPYIVGHHDNDHETFEGDFVAREGVDEAENIRSYGENILRKAEEAIGSHYNGSPPPPPEPGMPGSPPPMGIWNNHTITNIDGDVIAKGGKVKKGFRPKGILKNAKYATKNMVQRFSAGGAGRRGSKINFPEVGDIQNMHSFNEVCDELGVSPASHPELYDNHGKRGYSYKIAFFRSVRFKQFMMYLFIVAVLAIVIGVAVSVVEDGLKHVQNKKSLIHTDWNELDEKLKQKHANDTDLVGGGDEQSKLPNTSLSEEEKLDYGLEDEYFPIWYDRNSGWTGTTYNQAINFCYSKENFIPCPYEVYCPEGSKGDLIEGVMEVGDSWSPVSNANNEWVQVGTEGTCIKYSTMHNTLPEWGLKGVGNEQITKHIMCCRPNPLVDANINVGIENEVEADVTLTEREKEVQDYFHPVWFDSGDGWDGSTFDNAIAFCKTKSSNSDGAALQLCPLEAYCPNGSSWEHEPLYLKMNPFTGEQWAPFFSMGGDNNWVMVGDSVKDEEKLACRTYESLLDEKPAWGRDGTASEIKNHVLCCEQGFRSQPAATVPTPSTPHQSNGEILSSQNYEFMLSIHKPTKYLGRTGGWNGKTYQDSIDFCHSKNDSILCPYEVFCPFGSGEIPDGQWENDESWVAIINSVNEWVQVGSFGECNTYSSVYGKKPDWGLTGEGSEDKTRNIMCCRSAADYVSHDATAPQDTSDVGSKNENANESTDNSHVGLTDLEQSVVNNYKPVWYNSGEGWHGSSYDDAVDFCLSKSQQLCPLAAYCPNGPDYDGPPLFLHAYAFQGEQWAPYAGDNTWVLISDMYVGNSEKSGVCTPYFELFHANPDWGQDGTKSESKENILCCNYEQQSAQPQYDETYHAIWEKYYPVTFDRSTGWEGTTYVEGMEFCNSHDGYVPCPYDVYCPSGRGKLLEGVLGDDTSWAPIMDKANDWVQVGPTGECDRYSELYGKGPEWGTYVTTAAEAITEHIMCCLPESVEVIDSVIDNDESDEIDSDAALDTIDESESDTANANESAGNTTMTIAEAAIREQYDPIWYNVTDGWSGGTYKDAQSFCEFNSKELCPFKAYCPNGPDEEKPLFLQKVAFEGEQWAPTNNADNTWVLVGKISEGLPLTCRTHFELNHKLAEFGIDGSMRSSKRNIMCCNLGSSSSTSDNDSDGDGSHPGFGMPTQPAENTTTKSTEISHSGAGNSSPHIGQFSMEEGLMQSLHPVWFDSTTGWNGGSHDDAVQLCSSMMGTTGKAMTLCPYAVYCPNGPSKKPISINAEGRDFASEGEQWAPVFGQGDNVWVMIGMKGTNKVTQCLSYSQLHEGEDPEWGKDDSMKEIKKYVMCCSVQQ